MRDAATRLGRRLAHYLHRPSARYRPFSVVSPATLRAVLRPGDVLLVEGNLRISVAIKFLTQSTWSHAALYIGDVLPAPDDGRERPTLIEADVINGVAAVPISKYESYNTRICRPVGLSDADLSTIIHFAVSSIGKDYDLKNVVDLARYLLPQPPVPVRWRRRMLALGSGDPTRAICSTLIAQAFQAVRYPILPHVEIDESRAASPDDPVEREILHIRHHSLFVPRDFDLSPYFRVVKPTLESGFDYRRLTWSDSEPATRRATAARPTG